ncbi:MAG: sugar phosphate isomerase/epimerase [Candidatus Latescibacteria bacterium]|nr:sugar phosphate isomerase/epimerase [Candidatus Latescibacterota bacterium]
MAKIPVALQMYTVRDQAKEDFEGTFQKVAQIGYAGVELAGTGDRSASDLKKFLDGLNLKLAGSHVGWAALESDLNKVIEDNLTLGNPYIVCPSVPQDRRKDAAGYRETAQKLSQIGEACKKQGIQVCYHNHSFEFQKFDGVNALDILYEASDPRFLQAEIDTYWVQHGGEDPAAYIRKYAGRCPLVHLKDMEPGQERFFAEIGEGILDFKAIFEASEAGGAAWYIVEQDRCRRSPIDSARLSFENLKKMGKV